MRESKNKDKRAQTRRQMSKPKLPEDDIKINGQILNAWKISYIQQLKTKWFKKGLISVLDSTLNNGKYPDITILCRMRLFSICQMGLRLSV